MHLPFTILPTLITLTSAISLQTVTLPSSPRVLKTSSTDAFATMKISLFGAFVSNWTDEPNSRVHNNGMVSFHLHDPRPEYAADVHCVLPSSHDRPAYFNGYLTCGKDFPEPYVAFKLAEGQLTVLRGWQQENPRMYWVGIAEGPTYWKEETEPGVCPNKTTMPGGTFYHRSTEWDLPIHTVMSGN